MDRARGSGVEFSPYFQGLEHGGLMKPRLAALLSVISICLAQQAAVAQRPAGSPVSQALREELTRAMDILGKETDRAYFIGYQVNEVQSVNIEASLGALRASDADKTRYLDIDVRVGDYTFDSTHPIRGP